MIFNNGATITSLGSTVTVGGTLNLSSGGSPSIPNLTVSGTLRGTDTVTVTTALTWSGGSMLENRDDRHCLGCDRQYIGRRVDDRTARGQQCRDGYVERRGVRIDRDIQ